MIKKLLKNLAEIPEEFAENYFENLQDDKKDFYNYCDDIKMDVISPE